MGKEILKWLSVSASGACRECKWGNLASGGHGPGSKFYRNRSFAGALCPIFLQE
jgi:hypothetical protein